MRRFETGREISAAVGGGGASDQKPVHSHQTHAQSVEMTQQRWTARETRHRTGAPAAMMSLAAIDSLRALRSYTPALMSFISTSSSANAPTTAPAVPSASSSLLRVQSSVAERRSHVALRDRREGDEQHDHDYRILLSGTGVPTRLRTEQRQHQPRHFASITSSDSFARPMRTTVRRVQHEADTHAGFSLIPRSHELVRRVRDYETDSEESSGAPYDNEYIRPSTTATGNNRKSSLAPHSLRSAEPPAVAPRLPPASALLLPPPPPEAASTADPPVAAARQSPSSSSPHRKAVRGRRKGLTPEEKRKARTCVVDGCNNYIVHRHRCFRHGGGKRCSIDGCNTSAKQRGLCWRHGGSIICKIEGCTRGVKSKGVCWTHGEGKKKQDDEDDDANSSSSQPVYYCIFDDCYNAPVVNSFCETHSREVTQPGYVYEL